jgi:putative protein-disulfide isomerase
MTRRLHYIFDPLCGWCYGAAPLLAAASEVWPVVVHGGGMLTGSQRQRISPAWRNHVLAHDQRIAQLTGQTFGEAYRDGLLNNAQAVLDSEPPTAAILVADAMSGQGLDMLARIQTAHYVEGRQVSDLRVLSRMAAEIGLDAAAFTEALTRHQGEATQAHIAASRALLQRVGGRGFPTLALSRDGRYTLIDLGPHLGKPAQFQRWLQQLQQREQLEQQQEQHEHLLLDTAA